MANQVNVQPGRLLQTIGAQKVEIDILREENARLTAELAAATTPPTVKAAAGTIKPKGARTSRAKKQ